MSVPFPDDAAASPLSVDDISLSDLDGGTLRPDDMPWVGNESVQMLRPADIDDGEATDDDERTGSRLKAGWRPSTGKVRELPARGAGVPTIDEWLDFFSRVVIRVATDFAIEMAFKGIDEDLLSEAEVQRIKLTDDERDRIAKPFAEVAHRNKFTRKHGREIIAAAGSIDAILQLGLWYTRMTRIAMKYKRMTGQNGPQRVHRMARPPRQRPGTPPVAQTVVTMPVEEVITDERFGSSKQSQANGHAREWRPDVGGPVINPGG